jgi:DNA-binding response OmpR family regulator
MKKVLIIEDDQVAANVYRHKLVTDGYQAEITLNGEDGLKVMRTLQPDAILLDLILPGISGVDVIKQVRSEPDFSKLPIIVITNTYLTNMIQEAWKAGATKCFSKANCSPNEVLNVVRQIIGDGGTLPQTPSPAAPTLTPASQPAALTGKSDTELQANLRKSFIDGLPASLASLRTGLQGLIRADNEMTRLKHIHELYRRIHVISGNAGIVGLVQIAQMSGALEALLKELYEKPKNINSSTLRTVAAAVDFIGFLFEHSTVADKQEISPVSILIVDDEAISRRAIAYALEKAQLNSVSIEDPHVALKLLMENNFDLVLLDVDMPGMTGYELCTKLRNLPHHKNTPVVFVTILGDFDSRTSSMMAGGNDFIAKPFLFIELTVKALIHILRGKLQPAS